MLCSGDISPGHCDLLRIFDNPNESQDTDITQLLSKQALSTLKGADADAFELHLRNLMNAEFGIEYTAANVRIRFHEVTGQQICTVEIAKGSKPLFINLVDKNGVKSERFFVRSGNSSEPMDNPSEIIAYISKRFMAT